MWRLADVLECYAQDDSPECPLVCIDERPCQMIADTPAPLPVKAGQPSRYDFEYERHGVCNLFMIFQPSAGWRSTKVTAHRKQEDFAELMRELVDVHFPDAPKIRVVLDNLNIHSPASLYASFEPAETRRILQKLEFHFTPMPLSRILRCLLPIFASRSK